MRIVEAMGIPVAHTSFHIFDGVPAIISERYDRIVSANGTVTALHQEDFTQALGIPSSLKYEEHNGPTSNAYAEMLRKHGLPGQAESNIRAFTDGILASYLVGATGSHAKNYSLLLDGASVRLAPLYDLASGVPLFGAWQADHKCHFGDEHRRTPRSSSIAPQTSGTIRTADGIR